MGRSHLVQLGAEDVRRVGEDLQHHLHRRHGDVLPAELLAAAVVGAAGEGVHHTLLHLPQLLQHLLLQLPLDPLLGQLQVLVLTAGHLAQSLGGGGARGQVVMTTD